MNKYVIFISLMSSKENYFSTKKSTEELIMFIFLGYKLYYFPLSQISHSYLISHFYASKFE